MYIPANKPTGFSLKYPCSFEKSFTEYHKPSGFSQSCRSSTGRALYCRVQSLSNLRVVCKCERGSLGLLIAAAALRYY